uniref:Ribosomal protein S10 n=1 Tax=Nitella hyalina TaxID=181804 RepID=H9LR08_NITHY|nr:ribosomal protein S10 [Nitella hyalina]AEH42831.1 ribosomal protein S10 [Nitella hyalina]
MTAKIAILIKSFEIKRNTRALRLPKTRTLYTVLRSPHIDKKSREQFEMKIHKQLIVIQTETNKLREKLHYMKLHELFGVQLKVTLSYETRLEKQSKKTKK